MTNRRGTCNWILEQARRMDRLLRHFEHTSFSTHLSLFCFFPSRFCFSLHIQFSKRLLCCCSFSSICCRIYCWGTKLVKNFIIKGVGIVWCSCLLWNCSAPVVPNSTNLEMSSVMQILAENGSILYNGVRQNKAAFPLWSYKKNKKVTFDTNM